MPIFATLVRGKNYFLKDKHFVADEPKAVTAEEQAWLEEHAVDPITVHGGDPDSDDPSTEYRQKFSFSEGEKAPAPKRAARTRQRPSA